MAWQDNFISANDFDAIRLSVASKEDILDWSYGEVTKPETINYRTQKPERDGLFCERIFGPVKDINPNDPKLKGVRSREAAVDKDGNLVTKSITRRERMGHISLAAPVAHIWFMRGTPSAIGQLLDITVKNLEKVVYFAAYIITDADTEAIDKRLEDLEATTDAARQAIQMRYEEAAKQNGADVLGCPDDAAGGLQNLVHAGIQVSILEACIQTVLIVFPEQLPLVAYLRETGTDDDGADQTVRGKVDAFAEDTAHHAKAEKRFLIIGTKSGEKGFSFGFGHDIFLLHEGKAGLL